VGQNATRTAVSVGAASVRRKPYHQEYGANYRYATMIALFAGGPAGQCRSLAMILLVMRASPQLQDAAR
jgi:hypothetical protein